MRMRAAAVLITGLSLSVLGCGPKKSFSGPTVDAFTGRLVHNGQPVTFPEGDKVLLEVRHETGRPFTIQIQADGSFKVGWMPIGKYPVVALLRSSGEGRAPVAKRYNIPGGLTIEDMIHNREALTGEVRQSSADEMRYATHLGSMRSPLSKSAPGEAPSSLTIAT